MLVARPGKPLSLLVFFNVKIYRDIMERRRRRRIMRIVGSTEEPLLERGVTLVNQREGSKLRVPNRILLRTRSLQAGLVIK